MAPLRTCNKSVCMSNCCWRLDTNLLFDVISKAVINQVRNCEVVYDGRAWKNVSADAIDLINNLLKKDPKERLTANAALDHPFIVKRKRLSTSEPNPQLVDHIGSDLQRYADTTEFKKIALLAMANRMSSSEIVELRKIFSEFDENHHGTISKAEFKKALFNHGKYTEAEFESMFAGIDVNHTGSILYTGKYSIQVSLSIAIYIRKVRL